MAVEITTSGSPPAAWSDLLSGDTGADYFHTPTWTGIAARHLPGGRPLWLTAHLDGRLSGVFTSAYAPQARIAATKRPVRKGLLADPSMMRRSTAYSFGSFECDPMS